MCTDLNPPVLGLVTNRSKNKPEQAEDNTSSTIPRKRLLSLQLLIFFFFPLSKTYNVQQTAQGSLEFEVFSATKQGGISDVTGCGTVSAMETVEGEITC